jgi:hypothetical protein
MENLILDLIHRLENVKNEEKARVIQYKISGADDAARIIIGKILAIDFCINELNRMMNYKHQGEINR